MVKDSSNTNDDASNSNARTVKNSVMWGMLIITIPCMLASCCGGLIYLNKDSDTVAIFLIVPIIINLVTQITCASVIIAKAQLAVNAFGVKSDKVDAFASFGDCSSKYMEMSSTVHADITQAIFYMN